MNWDVLIIFCKVCRYVEYSFSGHATGLKGNLFWRLLDLHKAEPDLIKHPSTDLIMFSQYQVLEAAYLRELNEIHDRAPKQRPPTR